MGLKIKGKSAWQNSLWVWPSLIPLKTSSRHDANLEMLLGPHISASKCSLLQNPLFPCFVHCCQDCVPSVVLIRMIFKNRKFIGTANEQVFAESIEWAHYDSFTSLFIEYLLYMRHLDNKDKSGMISLVRKPIICK